MAKYYYRFLVESPEGRALRSFHRAAVKADEKAEQYAKRVGAETFFTDPNSFAGGVSIVIFKKGEVVNRNIWRLEQKNEETGEEWYMPNVEVVQGIHFVDAGRKLPIDLANRIFKRVLGSKTVNDTGKRLDVPYLEIRPVMKDAPKADRTRAVSAERMRLKLPVVRTEDFYRIVKADLTDVKKLSTNTPTFFLHHDRYYISMDYPSLCADFEQIDMGMFQSRMNDMKFEQRLNTEE